jgi:hypothetical protein
MFVWMVKNTTEKYTITEYYINDIDRGAGMSMGIQRPDNCNTDEFQFRLMRGYVRN